MTGETLVTYTPPGGTLITLHVVDTQEYRETPIHDARGKYMMTKVRIRVFAIYNTILLAQGSLARNAGDIAASLAHSLSIPRGRLVYGVGGTTMLESPRTGYTVDCANGPFIVEAPSVWAVHGNGKTFQVVWTVETYVNKCFQSANGSSTTALISHTWSMHDHIDQDYYTTRTIRGRAVFRADVLTQLSRVPDDYRILLTHPLPRNFKRVSVDVVANEDGNTADYIIVDKQMARNLIALGVARIEATHTSQIKIMSAEDMGDRFARSLESVDVTRPGTAFTAIIRWVQGVVPAIVHSIVVRVWGVPGTLLEGISNIAHRVAGSRVSHFANAVSYSADMSETRDVVGTFVELRILIIGGVAAAFTSPVLNDAVNFVGALNFPAADDGSVDPAQNIISYSAFNSDRNIPPRSNGMRGNILLARAVSQALVGACTTPPSNQPAYLAQPAGDHTS